MEMPDSFLSVICPRDCFSGAFFYMLPANLLCVRSINGDSEN
jgi:hypothetical protein